MNQKATEFIYSQNTAFESTQNMNQIWQTRDIRNDVIIMRGRIPLYSVVLSGVPLGKPYGICERNSTSSDPHSLITVFPVGICRHWLSGNLDREKHNLENLLKCAPEMRWECTLRTRISLIPKRQTKDKENACRKSLCLSPPSKYKQRIKRKYVIKFLPVSPSLSVYLSLYAIQNRHKG